MKVIRKYDDPLYVALRNEMTNEVILDTVDPDVKVHVYRDRYNQFRITVGPSEHGGTVVTGDNGSEAVEKAMRVARGPYFKAVE